MSTPYTQEYFDEIASSSDSSAAVVVPLLRELLRPATVVDVGCGSGIWLDHFRRQGAVEVAGIDGPWVDPSTLSIPPSMFEVVDLTQPPQPARRFDLVVCLEVAEHLPAESADAFVDYLTALGPAVAFSAAIPEQGGNCHLNEQWPAYWGARFATHGYRPIDVIRPAIWLDERVAWWFRQNLVLYVDREHVSRYERLRDVAESENGVLPLVHPELYLDRLQQAAQEEGAAAEVERGESLISRFRSRLRLRTRLRSRIAPPRRLR